MGRQTGDAHCSDSGCSRKLGSVVCSLGLFFLGTLTGLLGGGMYWEKIPSGASILSHLPLSYLPYITSPSPSSSSSEFSPSPSFFAIPPMPAVIDSTVPLTIPAQLNITIKTIAERGRRLGQFDEIMRRHPRRCVWGVGAEVAVKARTDSKGCRVPPELPRIPRHMVRQSSDYHFRKLDGPTREQTARGLVAIAAGIKQKDNVDAMVKKFPLAFFTIIIFHYDNVVSEWSDLDWYKSAIHIAAYKQSKWWFAKRFLHPSIIETYDYVFVWDEDVGVENFDGLQYMEVADRYRLEISQPATTGHWMYNIVVHRKDVEVHHSFPASWCKLQPPCAKFVEMMVPVFSWKAWNCVWNLIQNDISHQWGLDYSFQSCVTGDENERIQKMGIVDKVWVTHAGLETLGGNVTARKQLRDWAMSEYGAFNHRWDHAVAVENIETEP